MCEDFPCCGHEMNDCRFALHGTSEQYEAKQARTWAILEARGAYFDEGY
jgi:hypothetical protein